MYFPVVFIVFVCFSMVQSNITAKSEEKVSECVNMTSVESLTFNVKKTLTVANNQTVLFNVQLGQSIKSWHTLKVSLGINSTKEFKSLKWAKMYPLSFTIHGRGTVLSFIVPFGKNNEFTRAELIMCPLPNATADTSRKRGKEAKKHHYRQKASKWDDTQMEAFRQIDKVPGDDEPMYTNDARGTVSSTSRDPIKFDLEVITFSRASFTLEHDKEIQLKPKASEPWVRRVDFPPDANAVRISATSKDNICGILAVQKIMCPFITSEADLKLAQRWLTFTLHGTMIIKRDEMDSFYLVVLTLPNDTACGNPNSKSGRPDQKKHTSLVVTSVAGSSDYITPILLTLAYYAMYYIAIGPIKIARAMLGGKKEKQPLPISIRSDEDALMDASVSRCMSPRPHDDGQKSDAETGKLFSLDSSNSSAVNADASDPLILSLNQLEKDMKTRMEAALEHALAGGDDIPSTSKMVPPEMGTIATLHQNGDLRQRFPQSSASSDVSCVLPHRDSQNAQKLALDTPTSAYACTHLILCGFLMLVVTQQITFVVPKLANHGDMDICYYNARCGLPLGPLNAFNHTFSNIGFIALGSLALLILRRRYKKHMDALKMKGPDQVHSTGLPTHYGMMTALGVGMISQGALSAVYHQCPNASSIQFESINVYLTGLLALLKLYGSRHEPTPPHAAYGMALGVWTLATVSTVSDHRGLWWFSFCALEMVLMPLLSLQIYYHGHVAYSTESIKSALKSLKSVLWADMKARNWTPLFKHRLTALVLGNAVNIVGSIISASASTLTIPEYIIAGLVVNLILYLGYYMANKFSAKESVSKLTWFYIVAALVFWIPALKFFFTAATDWKLSPAESRALNQDCLIQGFYDSHDVWHLLSSSALFFSFMSLLTLDDDLKTKRRTDIAIF